MPRVERLRHGRDAIRRNERDRVEGPRVERRLNGLRGVEADVSRDDCLDKGAVLVRVEVEAVRGHGEGHGGAQRVDRKRDAAERDRRLARRGERAQWERSVDEVVLHVDDQKRVDRNVRTRANLLEQRKRALSDLARRRVAQPIDAGQARLSAATCWVVGAEIGVALRRGRFHPWHRAPLKGDVHVLACCRLLHLLDRPALEHVDVAKVARVEHVEVVGSGRSI
mmetsp:Transcript_5877/g.13681  ORF Transcript_5877/g.13681 Transcript_5877/m.13681 type:complete len:224 (-) Transcript_5877:267-938(-)